MKRLLFTLAAVLACAAPVLAQPTLAITSYELQIYLPGVDPQVGAPTITNAIPLTALTCGLATVPAPTGTVTNPRFVRFQDPANAALDCSVDRSAFLLALPLGTGYRATMTALYAGGVTARSLTSLNSFGVASLPPAVPARVAFQP